MKRILECSALAVAVSSCLLASAPALALTNVEANAGPQFNFVNPGARSLGMGGAFIGLADDSTSAYTNPAGLAQLSRKEWAVEVRNTDFSTYSVAGGRLVGPPTNIGLDTVDGLQTQNTDRTVTNLSFLSFAFPLEHGTLAVYRHELANFKADFTSNGIFVQTFGTAPAPGSFPSTSRIPPSISDVDLQIVNYGFAGSWRVGSKLMLGGSLNYYRFDFDTTSRRYSFDADGDGVESEQERLFVLDFSDAALSRIAYQRGDDGAVGFNLGMLWQPNDRWSLGAVYRHGPRFDYTYGVTVDALGNPAFQGTTEFKVPDVWGLGLGYRPSDSWRIAFDVSRVNYSQHADDVVAQKDGSRIDYLSLDNTTEFRLGAEYTAVEAKHPYQIRFGTWHEPAHQLAFDGTVTLYNGTPPTPAQNDANFRAALFIEGKDAWHGTLGYGIVFDKFQIDTAFDYAQRAKVFSVSMVYFLK